MTHSTAVSFRREATSAKGAAGVEEWDGEHDTRVSDPGQASAGDRPRIGGRAEHGASLCAQHARGEAASPPRVEAGCLPRPDPTLGRGGSSGELRDDARAAADTGLNRAHQYPQKFT